MLCITYHALQFFPTAEGFYDFENNEYIYQYKDHLGNVRLSFKNNNGASEISDQNDYYPFGMNIPREEKSIVETGTLRRGGIIFDVEDLLKKRF